MLPLVAVPFRHVVTTKSQVRILWIEKSSTSDLLNFGYSGLEEIKKNKKII